jgi:hypothetical protein
VYCTLTKSPSQSSTQCALKPHISRYNTTPVPRRPGFTTTIPEPQHHSRSFDRAAPTDSPVARAFIDATAVFGKTPRPSDRMTRHDSLPRRKATHETLPPRRDSTDSDDIIEDDDDVDEDRTPTRVLARTARQDRNQEAGPSRLGRQLSGSEKLLSFRYAG